MSDFTNELIRLGELREKGLISQEEFEAGKAKLFNEAQAAGKGGAESSGPPPIAPPQIPAQPTMVIPPRAPPQAPPGPAAHKVDDIPPGIKGWSWGAFLWNWIWAIFNNTWIGLLALVPGVNLVMVFVLGAKGREWAWKNKRWDSVEHFNRVQRKWSVWGIGLVLFSLLLSGLIIISSMFFMASAGSKFSGFSVPSGMDTVDTPAQSDESVQTAPLPEEIAPDAMENADMATPAIAEDAMPAETIVEDTASEDPGAQDAGEAQAQQQAELARIRAEADAAKAEAAKAKKDALKAEKALAEQRRLQEEERLAQEQAAQEAQMECPYSRAQPLTCSSRQGQPAYCDWNFQACGNPKLSKKESKTTCDGKVSTDRENNQLIVVDGCRAKFVPQQY